MVTGGRGAGGLVGDVSMDLDRLCEVFGDGGGGSEPLRTATTPSLDGACSLLASNCSCRYDGKGISKSSVRLR